MKKLLLILMLTVVSSGAMAEWVEVGGNDNVTSYADPTTIRKSGNKVKMWILLDFNSTQESATAGHKYLSSKSQYEFDCKEEQRKLFYFSWHSENMGGGDTVYIGVEPQKNWPIPPDSIAETIWKFACGK